MPTPPVSEEELIAAVEARGKYARSTDAARSLGLARTTYLSRLEMAALRGLCGTDPVMPGFEIAKVSTTETADGQVKSRSIQQRPSRSGPFNLPAGHMIRGVSSLIDESGRVTAQWIKTRAEPDPLEAIEAIKKAFENFEPLRSPSPEPSVAFRDRRVLYVMPDLHWGLKTWKEEVAENFDLKIARDQYGAAIIDLVNGTPASEEAIILGLGDQLHTQSASNVTPASGHHLQVDGRYQKILETACQFFVDLAELALGRHKHVRIRIIKGNHDPEGAVAIAYFLRAWYRNEPRVTVDVSPSVFWWYRFGNVLLGASHGHVAKPQDMPMIMASRAAEEWGQTKYRHVLMGHIHTATKRMFEGGGCTVETFQSPAAQDEYAFNNFPESGRSLSAIIYCPQRGEVGRTRVVVGA